MPEGIAVDRIKMDICRKDHAVTTCTQICNCTCLIHELGRFMIVMPMRLSLDKAVLLQIQGLKDS